MKPIRPFAAAVALLSPALCAPLHAGMLPDAKTPLSCDNQGLRVPTPGDSAHLDLTGTEGGDYTADSAELGDATLTRDLTIVTKHDIEIKGHLRVAYRSKTPVNIILVSLKGKVTIDAAGTVEGGRSDDGQDKKVRAVDAKAEADAGKNGGDIKIWALNIDVKGGIKGARGGTGGQAEALGRGSAIAWGGFGGHAGDVLLCAADSIGVRTNASVIAGVSGYGGWAIAESSNGEAANAQGGGTVSGGDVTFQGTTKSMQVFLEPDALVMGGSAGDGRWAKAVGGPAQPGGRSKQGCDATAQGGSAGDGGTVHFADCKVDNKGKIYAGGGGDGDTTRPALAEGGRGLDAPKNSGEKGGKGGHAEAHGGVGGAAGETPHYTDLKGAAGQGIAGANGKGEAAEAVAGSGGDGDGADAGRSGGAYAQGGNNGAGESPDHYGWEPSLKPNGSVPADPQAVKGAGKP